MYTGVQPLRGPADGDRHWPVRTRVSSELRPAEDGVRHSDGQRSRLEEDMSGSCQLRHLYPRGIMMGLADAGATAGARHRLRLGDWFMPRVITQSGHQGLILIHVLVSPSTHWSGGGNPDTALAALKTPVSGYPQPMPTMN